MADGARPGRRCSQSGEEVLVKLDPDDPRPVLLIDVDGVLNPWEAASCPAGFTELNLFPGEAVWLSPAHGDLLKSLAPPFELVWATAWEHRANQFVAPVLHLPQLPVIEFPLGGRDVYFRKLPAVIEATGTRPAAWIDDVHHPDHHDWAASRGAPTLIIDVDPAVGLTTAHAAQLADWAAGLAA